MSGALPRAAQARPFNGRGTFSEANPGAWALVESLERLRFPEKKWSNSTKVRARRGV